MQGFRYATYCSRNFAPEILAGVLLPEINHFILIFIGRFYRNDRDRAWRLAYYLFCHAS